MHEDHRQRLRKKFLKVGASAFADHELLEMLLFGAIPRCNTNNIAHALIDTFGSLSAVLAASAEDLMQVKGVGEAAVCQIKLIEPLFHAAETEKVKKTTLFESSEKAGQFGVSLLAGKEQETTYALLLDNSLRRLDLVLLSEGSSGHTTLNVRLLCQKALARNASAVILYHNHSSGHPVPSSTDIAATRELELYLSQIGILLLEHYVVADNHFNPILSRQMGTTRYLGAGMTFEQKTIDDFYGV